MQTIQSKVSLGAGAAVLAGVAAYASYATRISAASSEILSQARQHSNQVQAGMEVAPDTGRLLPHLVRNSPGEVSLEPLVDYENSERGPTGVRKGEYYQCSKESLAECVLNPDTYSIGGNEFMLTSLATLIVVGGRFPGRWEKAGGLKALVGVNGARL